MTRGMIYMAFGAKALEAVVKSVESLRIYDPDMPVAVVGDCACPIDNCTFINWKGPNPLDRARPHNLRFLAGRVKPGLYNVSPFEETMYSDADTEFFASVTPLFDKLRTFDMLVTRHPNQSIIDLYNVTRHGWAHNIKERDYTIHALGGSGECPYWNSGIILWRKCTDVEAVFSAWHREWLVWQQWDEQQALMRAVYGHPVRLLVLPEAWNNPHKDVRPCNVFHNYGRGVVRQ